LLNEITIPSDFAKTRSVMNNSVMALVYCGDYNGYHFTLFAS